jgi:acyl carrier protein
MSMNVESVIQQLIVERLMLPIRPSEIRIDAPLFGASGSGGLELDSLSSLELIAAVSQQFDLPLDDVEPADLYSVASIAAYLKRHGVKESKDD